jgi:hypothetical protein
MKRATPIGSEVLKYYTPTSKSLCSLKLLCTDSECTTEIESSSRRSNGGVNPFAQTRHPLTYISAMGHVTHALEYIKRVNRRYLTISNLRISAEQLPRAFQKAADANDGHNLKCRRADPEQARCRSDGPMKTQRYVWINITLRPLERNIRT